MEEKLKKTKKSGSKTEASQETQQSEPADPRSAVSDKYKNYYDELIAKLRKDGVDIPEFHRAAALFPWMPPEQFEELVESVRRARFAQHPQGRGQRLDGRECLRIRRGP